MSVFVLVWGCNIACPVTERDSFVTLLVAWGGEMHRSLRGLAAIWLVGWVDVSTVVSAQDAKPVALPPVQVDAPQPRQDARFKRKHSAGTTGRSNRAAIQNPAPVANSA